MQRRLPEPMVPGDFTRLFAARHNTPCSENAQQDVVRDLRRRLPPESHKPPGFFPQRDIPGTVLGYPTAFTDCLYWLNVQRESPPGSPTLCRASIRTSSDGAPAVLASVRNDWRRAHTCPAGPKALSKGWGRGTFLYRS